MSLSRIFGAVMAVLPVVASAQVPCQAPPLRDLKPLMQAVKEDRAMVEAYGKAAQACAERGMACDDAKLECGTKLTQVLKSQVSFDEGWWLRDMMMPYQGQSYPMLKPIAIGTPLTDVSCSLEPQQLVDAATRRSLQADRRERILNEYPKYVRWANEAFQRCKESSAADAARDAQTRAEAMKLAAAAAAAKAAEEARQKQLADVRKKEEEEQRRQHEVQVEAQKKADEQAKAMRDAMERQRREAEEAAAKAKKDQDRLQWEAQEKARIAAEEQKVKERVQRTEAQRRHREDILAQAEAEADQSEEARARRRKEALSRLDAEEEAERDAQKKKVEAAKRKAAGLPVDDSYERPRGSLAVMGGGGYGSVSEGASTGQAVMLGLQAALHVGLWGTAPAEGMASGLDLRVLGRFYAAVGTPAARTLEGLVTGRYFFGPVGVGVGGEYRTLMTDPGTGARELQSFDFGPSVSIAFADTPRLRAMFNATWLPLGTGGLDVYRVVGELEVGYEWFIFEVSGGSLSDPRAPARTGVQIAANVGVRLVW